MVCGMIAVRPPLYFPPLWYTALLHHVDHFILADTFRYRGQSFQNRSKLRNAQGTHWITIPLFGQPEGAPFHTVEIETGGRWREKHWRSFLYDYRTTMYFEFYEETIRPFFDVEWQNLADCTCRSVELQAELYGIDTSIVRASELEEAPASVAEIVDTLGAEALAVLSGETPPTDVDATVHPVAYDPPEYRQNFEGFIPGVTGMDLFLNYGREAPRLLIQGIGAPAASG